MGILDIVLLGVDDGDKGSFHRLRIRSNVLKMVRIVTETWPIRQVGSTLFTTLFWTLFAHTTSSGIAKRAPLITTLYKNVRESCLWCSLGLGRFSFERRRWTLPCDLDLKSPVMNHAATHCILSIESMSCFLWGFQMIAPYSKVEHTYEKYVLSLHCAGHYRKFLLRKPKVELAFFVILFIWSLHWRSDERRTPKYGLNHHHRHCGIVIIPYRATLHKWWWCSES